MEIRKGKIDPVMIGDLNSLLLIEIVDGVELDTQVEVNEGTLCCVAGAQKDEFIAAINEVIDKYRI